MSGRWQAIVLAAGRGPGDPMAKAYGVRHKCAIDIGGEPMLRRVVRTLLANEQIEAISVSIDDEEVARAAIGQLAGSVSIVKSAETASRSALSAVEAAGSRFPVLLTTGDHPLLTREMLDHFMSEAGRARADLCVGLATADTILTAFPHTKRTFLRFGRDRVSGCNLYALMNEKALPALAFWSELEQVRKRPWRIVSAFGFAPLLRFITGMTSLDQAFATASGRLGLAAMPVLMPFAEASIDVDKPADKELVESILLRRS